MGLKTLMSVEEFDRLEEPDQPARAQVVLQDTDFLEARDLLPGFALRIGALFG